MKHIALTLCIGLLLVGCTVSSSNPVSELADSRVPPDAWLGEWTVELILGETPNPPATITLARSSEGFLSFSLQQGEQTEAGNASLGETGGVQIASFPSSSGFWTLLSCVDAPSGDRLTLKSLDPDAVAADIQSGTVSGEVRNFGAQSDVIELTASTPQLQAYLSGRADLFTEEFLVLQRIPPAP